jgi:NAD(P)-dependent dehydrogenase (short-subunit alcohol dehydrogenase family)
MARFRLDGRVALITGAGSATGIGRAIATAYADAGGSVALGDVDVAGAERNADALSERGAKALGIELDVTQEASVAGAVARVESELGAVDILVNNAGITSATRLADLTVEEFDRLMAINLRGGFLCLKAVLPGMMSRRRGRVIWLSSVAAKQGGGVFGTSHYAASKAGIIGLCQGAARELGPHGITSNAIAPSMVLTGLIAKTAGGDVERRLDERNREMIPVGRSATPEDVAAGALFLASDEAAYITGEVLDVNGGLYFD